MVSGMRLHAGWWKVTEGKRSLSGRFHQTPDQMMMVRFKCDAHRHCNSSARERVRLFIFMRRRRSNVSVPLHLAAGQLRSQSRKIAAVKRNVPWAPWAKRPTTPAAQTTATSPGALPPRWLTPLRSRGSVSFRSSICSWVRSFSVHTYAQNAQIRKRISFWRLVLINASAFIFDSNSPRGLPKKFTTLARGPTPSRETSTPRWSKATGFTNRSEHFTLHKALN